MAMVGPSRIITNVTNDPITISEAGIVLDVGESRDLLEEFALDQISRFESLLVYIIEKSLVLNDGLKDYTDVGEAIRILANYTQVTPNTYDGKLIIQMSPRPLSPKTYTHWTGRSDDLVDSRRGLGDPLMIDIHHDEETKEANFHFLSDSQVYLRQGYIAWEGAGWGNSVSANVMSEPTPMVALPNTPDSNFIIDQYHRILLSPGSGTHVLAGHPVPVPMVDYNKQPCGHWNLKPDMSGFDYAPDGDGIYDWFDISLKVNTFVNHLPVYKDCYQYVMLDSDDVELIAPGYYLNIVAYNPAHVDFKVWAFLVTYREETM